MFKFLKMLCSKEKVLFKCHKCGFTEYIPLRVVTILDFLDKGNKEYPPSFSCNLCLGLMEPTDYTNYKGKTYTWKK